MDMATAIAVAGSAIGAGIAVFTGIGAGLGQDYALYKLDKAVGNQPEAKSEIMSSFIVGAAIAESTAIYGLIIAMILIFVIFGYRTEKTMLHLVMIFTERKGHRVCELKPLIT